MDEPRAQVLDSRQLYTGRIVTLDVDRVRTPGGREVSMEVVRHPGSVVLVAMPEPRAIFLVRQYRYAVDRWIWELPAGSLNPGEDPTTAAVRECHEEVGLVPTRVERLGAFFPTPGYCSEEMIFYRLTGLQTPAATGERDEDEDLEPRVFGLDEVRALLRSGEIVDMKTAVGLTLIQ